MFPWYGIGMYCSSQRPNSRFVDWTILYCGRLSKSLLLHSERKKTIAGRTYAFRKLVKRIINIFTPTNDYSWWCWLIKFWWVYARRRDGYFNRRRAYDKLNAVLAGRPYIYKPRRRVIRFPFHHDKRNAAPLPTRRRGVVRGAAVESSGRGESCVSRGGEGLWGIVRRRGGGGSGRVVEWTSFSSTEPARGLNVEIFIVPRRYKTLR